MPPREKCRLFLIVDPTSTLAEHIENIILTDGEPRQIPCTPNLEISDDMSDALLKDTVREWLVSSGFIKSNGGIKPADERIVKLVCEIRDYKHLEDSITDIAKESFLSESRLSHIFKECMGISLKGYLNIAQVRYAYKLITEGREITCAALEAGFGSSAHLAAFCKTKMGISVSEVLE